MKTNTKIIAGILAVMAIISGSLVSVVILNSPRVAGEFQENEIEKIKADYRAVFEKTMDEYLKQADQAQDLETILTGTEKTRNIILSLKVSAEQKEFHLKTVLLLDAISNQAKKQEATQVAFELAELKTWLKNF